MGEGGDNLTPFQIVCYEVFLPKDEGRKGLKTGFLAACADEKDGGIKKAANSVL